MMQEEIEMSTYDLSTEPELVVKSRQAAYCARRRLGDVELSQADMEDLIQTAALVVWPAAVVGH